MRTLVLLIVLAMLLWHKFWAWYFGRMLDGERRGYTPAAGQQANYIHHTTRIDDVQRRFS
jgi:hypothetical protein